MDGYVVLQDLHIGGENSELAERLGLPRPQS